VPTSRIKTFWVPIIAGICLALGIILGFFFARRQSLNSPNSNTANNPLLYLSALLESYYVDPLPADSIYQYSVEGILNHLDPHTHYIQAKELQALNEPLEGSFYGLGIVYFSFLDTLYVGEILQGSPAQKIGLQAGDQLIAINNIPIRSNDYADSVIRENIQREKTQVIQLLVRNAKGITRTVRCTPNKIQRSSIRAQVMLDSVCGLIAIESFSETTPQEFHDALKQLKQEGLKKLIIDVRANPGGYMDAVAQIADELISGNDTLFYTRDQTGKQALMAGQAGLFETGPLIILLDEESASASEILAGVVQDYDRGQVFGKRSFGKGLVQEQFDLPNGDAIRITTARYYLPSGRFIQRPYQALSHQAYFNSELASDTNQQTPFYTRLLHRNVWSGRGIEPDKEIDAYQRIEDIPDNVFIRKTVFDLYHQQQNELPAFNSLQAMRQQAHIPLQWLNTLKQSQSKLPDSLQFLCSKQTPYLTQLALAEWANVVFGHNGQVMFSWPHDVVLREALHSFRNNNKLFSY
jgi:carboxyl-terminal processing protease